MVGVGIMAALDEIVFHQILSWHHFYGRSTPEVGLMADGLLHAGELILIVAGFFLIADLRHRRAFAIRSAWSGFFLGAGGFQLFDGVANHKILRLHQVRYDVESLVPYDIAWVGAAILLLLVGLGLTFWSRAEKQHA